MALRPTGGSVPFSPASSWVRSERTAIRFTPVKVEGTSRMRYAVHLVVVIGLSTLSGCSQGTVTTPARPTGTSLTAPATALRPPVSGRLVTILGVVRAGALPGCNVVQADDGRHNLLLDTPDPPLNVPVVVTGVVDTSLVSYCNNGWSLHVRHISPR